MKFATSFVQPSNIWRVYKYNCPDVSSFLNIHYYSRRQKKKKQIRIIVKRKKKWLKMIISTKTQIELKIEDPAQEKSD